MGLSQPKVRVRYRQYLLWLIALVFIGWGIYALYSPPSPPAPFPLDRRIAKVEFRNTPLEQALNQLGDSVGMKVIIDRNALRFAEVNLKEPMNLRLHDVSLEAAFHRLSFEHAELCAMEPTEKGLLVTTRQALPSTVRIYDITDPVDQWLASPAFKRKPEKPDDSNLCWKESLGGPHPIPTRDEIVEQIARLITDTVDSDNWSGNGGTENLSYSGTLLIISGRPAAHREIQKLLRRLRTVGADGAERCLK